MKIVLALVLVACVAVQASPVNKTSVGEGEDGVTASVTITGFQSGDKTRWTQVVYTTLAKMKCPPKKVCLHPLNKKVVLSKCNNLGTHCKVARTTWFKCNYLGSNCKATKHVDTSIWKMWLKKVCSDCKKKGMKGYSKGFCKDTEARFCKELKDGDDEDDSEDDGEDDGHPKIKIGKLCVHCKGKHCDIVKCKDGDDEDDGAHPKSLSLCIHCEKKGGKTHCKEVKCKDGDDEDDGTWQIPMP